MAGVTQLGLAQTTQGAKAPATTQVALKIIDPAGSWNATQVMGIIDKLKDTVPAVRVEARQQLVDLTMRNPDLRGHLQDLLDNAADELTPEQTISIQNAINTVPPRVTAALNGNKLTVRPLPEDNTPQNPITTFTATARTVSGGQIVVILGDDGEPWPQRTETDGVFELRGITTGTELIEISITFKRLDGLPASTHSATLRIEVVDSE